MILIAEAGFRAVPRFIDKGACLRPLPAPGSDKMLPVVHAPV
jgi:hypothetical protein